MKRMAVSELTQALQENQKLHVVDVRPEASYKDWHISGSTNWPAYNALVAGDQKLVTQMAESLPKDTPLVMVCNVGKTSQLACAMLDPLGYQTLNLDGGMREWSLAWTTAQIDLGQDIISLQVRRNGKGCFSYLLASQGKALLIDPALEPEAYTELLNKHDLVLEAVAETHVHADHISRGRRIAQEMEVPYYLPENDRVTFDYQKLNEDDILHIGNLSLRVISTPGHTGESVCYYLNNKAIFSGDTLFTDNFGRPDLERGDAGADAGARALYHTLTNKLLTLPGDVLVCPAHTSDAIGFDRKALISTIAKVRDKLALDNVSEEQFAANVVEALSQKPGNFQTIIAINEGKLALEASVLDYEAGPNRCAAKV